jgi:hypothetical protein
MTCVEAIKDIHHIFPRLTMYGSVLIIDIFTFYLYEKIFIEIKTREKSYSMLINYLIAFRVKGKLCKKE